MPLSDDERRRYFRIEDTVGVSYEPLSEAEAKQREVELKHSNRHGPDRLHRVERQLQLLIDKLRIQQPEFAEAIELLNVKFNTLKASQVTDDTKRRSYIRQVNLSACGISLEGNDKFASGQKLYIDLTLLPTDLHIYTLGEVIDCKTTTDPDWNFVMRIDFYGMSAEDEELLVQHMVKRQARILHEERGM